MLTSVASLSSFKTMAIEPAGSTIILSTSRSASTVLLSYFKRVLRGYLVYNEPTSPVHYKDQSFLYEQTRLKSYDEVKAIYTKKDQPILVKEISHISNEFLKNEPGGLDAFKAFDRFIFLVGDPYAQVNSMYRLVAPHFDKVVDFSGLLGQQDLHELITILTPHLHDKKVALIKTENLCSQPGEVLRKVHQKLEMEEFDPANLSWTSGQKFGTEYKKPYMASLWHDKAITSTEFVPLSCWQGNGEPEFEHISNEKHRGRVKEAYRFNLDFYKKITTQFSNYLV